MKKLTIGPYSVEIYDSIDELPIKRFHKYNKMLLIDSGIGSDLNDINAHIAKIGAYLSTDRAKALAELENMRQSLYFISEEISPRHLAFIPLVYSINGSRLEDLSDENIKRWQARFAQGAKVGWFEKIFQSIKKKMDDELTLYFPGQFDDIAIKEYYDRLREQILLKLDTVIRGRDNEEKISRINDQLLTHARPQVFSGRESIEIKYDKQFDEMCTFLMHRVGVDPDKMTVLQFYNAFDYIKKANKPDKTK